MAPGDGAGRQRADEGGAQVRAVDLGAVQRGVVGGVLPQQDRPGVVEQAVVLALAPGHGQELRLQSGLAQRTLAGVGVQVEHAALGAGGGRGVALVHDGFHAVQVEDAGQEQAAGPGSDDGDA